ARSPRPRPLLCTRTTTRPRSCDRTTTIRPAMTTGPTTSSPRRWSLRTSSLARVRTGNAGIAFSGLLAFILIVYANPGNCFAGLEDIGFAKTAAGLSLAALGGSWLLYSRRLTIGGVQGWALLILFALVGMSASWSFWPKFSFDTFVDGLKYLAIFFLVVNTVD